MAAVWAFVKFGRNFLMTGCGDNFLKHWWVAGAFELFAQNSFKGQRELLHLVTQGFQLSTLDGQVFRGRLVCTGGYQIVDKAKIMVSFLLGGPVDDWGILIGGCSGCHLVNAAG